MTTLYKVLVDGKAAHGGEYTYDLPTQNADGTWTPGYWTTPVSDVAVCRFGYHLTERATDWLIHGCSVYLAEGRGTAVSDQVSEQRKIAYESVRLLRPAPEAVPNYWTRTEAFIASIEHTRLGKPDGNPDPDWKLFTDRSLIAAKHAAHIAVLREAGGIGPNSPLNNRRSFARHASETALTSARRALMTCSIQEATRAQVSKLLTTKIPSPEQSSIIKDALTAASMLLASDLHVTKYLRDLAHQCWEVWRKGYILYGEVSGELYVYAQEETQ